MRLRAQRLREHPEEMLWRARGAQNPGRRPRCPLRHTCCTRGAYAPPNASARRGAAKKLRAPLIATDTARPACGQRRAPARTRLACCLTASLVRLASLRKCNGRSWRNGRTEAACAHPTVARDRARAAASPVSPATPQRGPMGAALTPAHSGGPKRTRNMAKAMVRTERLLQKK